MRNYFPSIMWILHPFFSLLPLLKLYLNKNQVTTTKAAEWRQWCPNNFLKNIQLVYQAVTLGTQTWRVPKYQNREQKRGSQNISLYSPTSVDQTISFERSSDCKNNRVTPLVSKPISQKHLTTIPNCDVRNSNLETTETPKQGTEARALNLIPVSPDKTSYELQAVPS